MSKQRKTTRFAGISALFINCSIKKNKKESHTQLLMNKAAAIMTDEGVTVEKIYALDHTIAFGMVKDGKKEAGIKDDWPKLQKKIMAADILVIGTPIWLGVKSSVATQVIERMYAYSGDRNEMGQYLYYGKTGGCIITGNEDGIKHCAMDILYALQHIGYTVPPQADAGWIGEAGPGPSYGDTEWQGKPIGDGKHPVGFDNEFTNRNTTFMAWNLMHLAKMFKKNKGISAIGNVVDNWRQVTNAENVNPEYR
ncbi:MAG: flavodoxin [Candidatus Magasanikbacteria bacterium CG10_big_fil_rev_8_21_14_0_10_47_10]|uniref:Flavodoxin n=1 Tax=Candidatus Magasanikbacteria bacterium CG10_big_fil_rev_8_21_14_0_10_47_10 TaxID=1974652 RepID=A0A2H0TRK9_9BACT|nr:MAG: flavodoxin [Candidatus Magasanikbacteria bacterium CG10_big_fil_rev_8_21_14_0_10_47_10]